MSKQQVAKKPADEDEYVSAKLKELTLSINEDEPEKRISALYQRYSDLSRTLYKCEKEMSKSKKTVEDLQKERDQAKFDFQKTSLLKDKLETLCRELHKENARIREESVKMMNQEQEKRQEMSLKLEEILSETKAKLLEQEERKKNQEAIEAMRQQLLSLKEEYEFREKHFETVLSSKELEHRILEARIEKQQFMTEQEKQKADVYKIKIEELLKREEELNKQLSLYVHKFEEIQETISKSNSMFTSFKKEMDQTTKKLRHTEKENVELRAKCESLNKKMIVMLDERLKQEKQIELVNTQKTKLESLCRALQDERKSLISKLNELEKPTQDKPSAETNKKEEETASEATQN